MGGGGVHGAVFSLGIQLIISIFSFVYPYGRYGRIDGVTVRLKRSTLNDKGEVRPFPYSINSTIAATGKDINLSGHSDPNSEKWLNKPHS